MFAVIQIGPSQFLVQPGDKLDLPLPQNSPSQLTFSQVLLFSDNDQVEIGQPYLSHINVTASNLGVVTGPRVRVYKYKAKSRYGKTTGSHPHLVRIQIDQIGSQNSPLVENSPTKSKQRSSPKSVSALNLTVKSSSKVASARSTRRGEK